MSDTTQSDDPFLTLKLKTQQTYVWPAQDIMEERYRLLKVVVFVLVQRALYREHNEKPSPTCWPGLDATDMVREVKKAAFAAYVEYRGWLSNKDAEPVSQLGQHPQQANRGGGVTSTMSRTRAVAHDQVRLVLVCAALSGWQSFASFTGLHHAIDILDGVTRVPLGSGQTALRRTRHCILSEEERQAVLDLASELSHSRMADLLNVAANYVLTYRQLDHPSTRGLDAQEYLSQRQTTGLTTTDPVVVQLSQMAEGQPSRYQQLWQTRHRG